MLSFHRFTTTRAVLLAATIMVAPIAAVGSAHAEMTPDGKTITPLALPGAVQQFLNPGLASYPNFVAGQALRAEVSPSGKMLAVLCAGQNSLDDAAGNLDSAASTQWIFVYDISGANAGNPALLQAIPQTNAHVGLVWSPDSKTLYAAGGNDDAVYAYTATGGVWAQSNKIALGHVPAGTHANGGIGGFVQPNASGLAISADGATMVAVNNYNDSISVIDVASGTVRYEHSLRPYFANNEGASGVAGGEYPFGVVLKGSVAYVSSSRDREVVAVDVSSPTAGALVARIKLDGNALGMALAGTTLYVAQDNADEVAVINTTTNTVTTNIDTRGTISWMASTHVTGAAPISVRLDPTGKYLFAVNAGANSVAVIRTATNKFAGLLPTAYEPTDVAFSADGGYVYIINGKSNTGPNGGYLYGNTARVTAVTLPGGNTAAAATARATNNYQFQLEKASLVAAPLSATLKSIGSLTMQVRQNNGYFGAVTPLDTKTMAFLRKKIQHVIYIVKENRTFDQILGDLGNGSNGQPSLTMFGQSITPSLHALAKTFVTLDNFQDPGDGSMDGWSWAMTGRVTNTEAITQQINYAFVNRGLSYETEGTNRNVPVGLATTAARDVATGGAFSVVSAALPGGTANLLPGTANHAAPDAVFGTQQGYIFDAVLNAGLTVRNYGFMVNNIGSIGTIAAPVTNPYASGLVQVAPVNPNLTDKTDVYFRGYDQNYPDLWRYNEWKREFDQYVAGGKLPNLELVRFSHDHTGSFGTALGGVNTPETQQADDDYTVGKLVEAVSQSPFANSTLIIITEDDCQDGPDHVDSHRATTYVAGPYVKKSAVVSTHYSQVNVLRTIEDIFGTQHINLNTATQRPMSEVFDTSPANATWSFTATASTVLATTSLFAALDGAQAVQFAEGPAVTPTHDAAYWAKATEGFDFSMADQVPADLYNRVMWQGLKGDLAYPKLAHASFAGVSVLAND